MFILQAQKNKLSVLQKEEMTSGSVNVYQVKFTFSADWDGLIRTAVFKYGSSAWSVLLDGTGECAIPWEALLSFGRPLSVGVYGTQGGETVLPTIWADLGTVREGVTTGASVSRPPPAYMSSCWQSFKRPRAAPTNRARPRIVGIFSTTWAGCLL